MRCARHLVVASQFAEDGGGVSATLIGIAVCTNACLLPLGGIDAPKVAPECPLTRLWRRL
jgi:hypothetical protein